MTKILTPIALLLFTLSLPAWSEPAETADPEDLRTELEQARADLAAAAQRLASLTRQMSSEGFAARWPEVEIEKWREQIGELPDGETIRRAIAVAWSPRLGIVLGADDEADGHRVRAVTPGSSAAAAGIEPGDRLLRLNGADISQHTGNRVRQMLREREAGETVTLDIERDGQTQSFEITLERPQIPGLAILQDNGERFNVEELRELIEGRIRPGRMTMLGRQTQLTGMHEGLAPYFGTDRGVLVLRIDPDNGLNLEAGDVVLSVDGEELNLPADLMRHLMRHSGDAELSLELMRRGERQTITGSWDAQRSGAERRQRG